MNPNSDRSELVQTLRPSAVFSGPPYAHVPRSYKGLVQAFIVIIILSALVGAGIWSYNRFFAPPALARASSDKYVNALTTDDVDWAAYLSAENADFSLLESAAQAVKGEYKLDSTVHKGNSYYFLYSLTNAINKYARVVVVSTAKGYRINSFIYSSGVLALTPDDETATPGGVAAVIPDNEGTRANVSAGSGSTGAQAGSASGTSTGGVAGSRSGIAACLAQPDYAAVFADGAADDGSKWTASNPYTVQISFNTGSTDYVDEFEIGDIYATWVKFYQTYPSKSYTMHVGAVAYSTDTSLASQRAAKAGAALTSVGVPSSKIITDSTKVINSGDDTDGDGYATLSVVPGSGC